MMTVLRSSELFMAKRYFNQASLASVSAFDFLFILS